MRFVLCFFVYFFDDEKRMGKWIGWLAVTLFLFLSIFLMMKRIWEKWFGLLYLYVYGFVNSVVMIFFGGLSLILYICELFSLILT